MDSVCGGFEAGLYKQIEKSDPNTFSYKSGLGSL